MGVVEMGVAACMASSRQGVEIVSGDGAGHQKQGRKRVDVNQQYTIGGVQMKRKHYM